MQRDSHYIPQTKTPYPPSDYLNNGTTYHPPSAPSHISIPSNKHSSTTSCNNNNNHRNWGTRRRRRAGPKAELNGAADTGFAKPKLELQDKPRGLSSVRIHFFFFFFFSLFICLFICLSLSLSLSEIGSKE
eukprot:Pompholyxophrys_punicea_v1_NODE_618_length_1587_cov_7.462794.p2 type:complete len:131 gc:universal NODE_618_length_1587_cov_7.462794:554-162(-)